MGDWRLRCLALGLALIAAAPVPAAAQSAPPFESKLRFENKYWSVYENADNCAMLATYGEGESLWLSINQRADMADLRVVTGGLGRLTDGQDYQFTVMFIDMAGDANSAWPDAQFGAFAMPDNRYGIAGTFTLADFARDFNRYQLMGVLRGETIVTSMALDGAGEAFTQLRGCDNAVEQRRPTDPLTRRR